MSNIKILVGSITIATAKSLVGVWRFSVHVFSRALAVLQKKTDASS
ncbi:MAG: hypothetical protein HRU24_07500 [Gammaproteobacteria bacterium]|nr:hypothetical protein [Gammaproteobacteria bacterium]